MVYDVLLCGMFCEYLDNIIGLEDQVSLLD